jgi:hypothetical protein
MTSQMTARRIGSTMIPLAIVWGLVIAFAWVSPAGAQIQYEGSAYNLTSSGTATSLTVSFNLTACQTGTSGVTDQGFLVVPMAWHRPSDPGNPDDETSEISVVWDDDGVIGTTNTTVPLIADTKTCSRDTTVENYEKCVAHWGLNDPSTGNGLVRVTFTNAHEIVAGAILVCGVEQVGSPIAGVGTASNGNKATELETSGPTSDGALCIDIFAVDAGVSHQPSADQILPFPGVATFDSVMAQSWGDTNSAATTDSMCTHSSRISSTIFQTFFSSSQLTKYDFSDDSESSPPGDSGNPDVEDFAAIAIVCLDPFLPTAVGFDSVQIQPVSKGGAKSGALVHWRTGLEADNLGFRIHRDDRNGDLKPVTEGLIAGSAISFPGRNLEAGYSYRWFDPEGAADSVYWIESIDLHGKREMHGPYYPSGAPLDRRPVKTADSMLLEDLVRAVPNSGARSEIVYPDLQKDRPASARELEGAATQRLLAATDSVKISVSSTGWYRVTYEDLTAAGFDAGAVDPAKVQVYAWGIETPIWVDGGADGSFDPGDAVEFLGIARQDQYSGVNVYWLIEGDQAGRRVGGRPASQTGPASTISFSEVIERRERLIHVTGLINGDAENFFGPALVADPVDQLITAVHPTAHGKTELEIAIQGLTKEPHQVQVDFNGATVGYVTFETDDLRVQRFPIAAGSVLHGDNTVTLRPGIGGDGVSLVDSVRLTYERQSIAANNRVAVRVDSAAVPAAMRFDGFADPEIRVVDVTYPWSPLIVDSQIVQTARGWAVDLGATGYGRRDGTQRELQYFAMAKDAIMRPDRIELNSPSQWTSGGQGADWVLVTSRELLSGFGSLADYREASGLSVAMIAVEDLFDELTFGRKSPDAIRGFLELAAESWSPAPSFVVLGGDGSYDPRDYLGFGQDHVPTKLLEAGAFETPSDMWFVENLGVDAPSLGRLPATDAAEAEHLAAKVVSHEGRAQELSGALFVSDEPIGDDFKAFNDDIIAGLPGGIAVQHVSAAMLGQEEARIQNLAALNLGVPFVHYSGHGSIDLWRGSLLTTDDAWALQNDEALTFFSIMNCLNGLFHEPLLDGLGEALLSAPAGAVGVLASTEVQDPARQDAVVRAFHTLLFASEGPGTYGEVVAAALSEATPEARLFWVLLGDPATTVVR